MIDIKPLPPKGWVRFFAGPHGSGKTTLRAQIPGIQCVSYINPDQIQEKSGVPFDVACSYAAFWALRSFETNDSFEFETVLASDFSPLFEQTNYRISLIYCVTESVDRCVQNVDKRVENGGHNVPEDKIRKCYTKSINTFCKLYGCVAECYLVFNDGRDYTLVTHSINGKTVYDAPGLIGRLPQELQAIINKHDTCKCR